MKHCLKMMVVVAALSVSGCIAETIEDKVEDVTEDCQEIIDETIESFWEDLEAALEKKEIEVMLGLGCERILEDEGWDCSRSVICE